jgi:hypothetical protein
MIAEPLLKLALSLESNPGVYALLIGSGVSRDAKIPTGEEIVIELIRKLAAINGEEPEPDPTSWYRQKFGKEPNYGQLLDNLASTPAERRNLLRPYFEPTSKESEQDFKVPTVAHKAIAALAKMGYIRMILTTNFDRLTEIALNRERIVPDIISSEEHLEGGIPYVHSKCYLVKLHGDYLDPRIKNTPEELANYSPKTNEFLDDVFDDFGLIVCGWSSESDTASKNAILRCPNRRFTTFWLSKGELNESAKKIINQRRAEVIAIDSADQAFCELLEKVDTLRELQQANPISTDVAVSTVKRYIVDPRHRIRLHDLFQKEVEKNYMELNSDKFDVNIELTKELFQERMQKYEQTIERLTAMAVALSYHDTGENAYLLTKCTEKLANDSRRNGIFPKLQLYPALLLTYACGVNSIANNQYTNLAAILRNPRVRDYTSDRSVPSIEKLNVWNVFNGTDEWISNLDGMRHYTQASDYLFEKLKQIPCGYAATNDAKYTEIFDKFEYILALTHFDLFDRLLPGRFAWRYSNRNGEIEGTYLDEFVSPGLKGDNDWELLKLGFFGGSVERFQQIYPKFRKDLQKSVKEWHWY